jgi:hypothetical protein
MNAPIGPVTSEAAVEIAVAMPGLARLLITGAIGFSVSHPSLTHLAGIEIGAGPKVGIARPHFDRTDPDATEGGGWTPVYSRHDEHQRNAPCVLLPGTVLVCCECLAAVCLDSHLELNDAELAGVTGLIAAVAVTAPQHPCAGVPFDDLVSALHTSKRDQR